MDEATTAVFLGIALGVGYGVTSYLTFLWAMSRPGVQFIVVALGGMLVRMALAFVLVAVITFQYDVVQQPFFLGFLATFLIVLPIEIGAMHKGFGLNTNEKASDGVTS